MKPYSLLVPCLAAIVLAGCDIDTGIRGSGNVVTVQRPIEDFTEISARGGVRVDWHSGAPSLSVTTDDNLVDLFETKVAKNRLEMRSRERVRPTRGIKVAISSASLNAARLSGAADLVAHGITGNVFAVETTGAASITLDGTVDELLADMTGASELKAKGLQAKVVGISATGAADAWVTASEKLRVAITGAGDVTYSGNPATIEKKVTGAGSIHHKE
jgi:hypothetical protein